jgi:hypothetical protein
MAKKKTEPQKPVEPQSVVNLDRVGNFNSYVLSSAGAHGKESIGLTRDELQMAFDAIAKVLSERENGNPPILYGIFRPAPIAPYGERISFPVPSDRGDTGYIVFRHTQDDMIEVYSEAGRLTIEPQVSNVIHIGIVKED